ncbi:MAG: D-alanyl-D-alanine carboxypeptidase, partial [Pseudomonadota bacterium]|nr:D-alanyl-D-alanine carboxypeptidase [Pseudomonadota bacterium]
MIGLMRMFLPLPTLAVALALPFSGVAAQTAPPPPLSAIAHQLEQAPSGARYGLLVATLDGAPVLAIAPDERFIPASNTKMFTTATAYADLAALDWAAQGTGVRIEGRDVILEGRGDARLSSAADCRVDCLQTLADAIAARTRRVRDVIGDDSWYPDERWGPGMSWNNIQSRYGTGVSALTLDDNEVTASVAPG